MKKFILLILPILLTLSSCEKNEYIVPNRTILVTLGAGNWISSAGGRNYLAAIDVPEIDSYFNDYGAVLVYASFGNHVYEQIPEVYDGVSYSFSHKPGQIVIEIQSSDGKTVISPPGNVTIKVVLLESK
ncbi:MAG: hypothetical protein K0S09_1957 [Sphingobacteriaceae bacterium]|jgi:hypothetical protein|nr:hypothetical protein [Sphingobacteriaceae bacterium]